MYLSIGQASSAVGVSVSTLRRWERAGMLTATVRTAGGHRRYDLRLLQEKCGVLRHSASRLTIAYARVSSSDQREDLERQKARLEAFCAASTDEFEVIHDLGSGLNYKKRGLKRLIHLMIAGMVERLILTHKDRLLRFGAEIIFYLCAYFGTKVEMIDDDRILTDEEVLTRDVIELMTVFSSRLYGKRAHKNKAISSQM